MKVAFRKKLLVTLVASLWLPLAASAADADLMQKIEDLSRELQALKAQVTANEQKAAQAQPQATELADLKNQVTKLEGKSLSKWLTVGGDYRFRFDSLEGQSKTFTDVNATFMNAQNTLQSEFFANPAAASSLNPAWTTAQALSGLMGFSQAMGKVATYDQANAFLGANASMAGAMGAFAATVPAYKPKNTSQYSNRFGLDLGAKATQDISVNAHLNMYKVFGSQDEGSVTNAGSAPFFADRVGVFDGTLGHVPSNSALNVDRVYATWSNIGDEPVWLSVGRRPSTGGAPGNLRDNRPNPGNGGTPSMLVDYAFDGMTVGYAPDVDGWPGAYAKICYGRGFENGFTDPRGNSLKDTDMLGVAIVPIDTDPLRVWLQWNRGMNIFDAPTMRKTYFGDTTAKTNLGDIDWFGMGFMSTFKNIGPGKLNVFGDLGVSITHPNQNVSAQFGFQGLMTGGFFSPEAPTSKTGTAIALGVRYDLPSNSKFGLEYNHGSKNWITFAPAADDMWTAKVGTRGDVVEAYFIQELDRKPISSFFSKAFFRLGVQYYKFDYTGSNNWVGAPVAIGDVNGQMMTTTPLENATNLYATFEVKF
ncbi:conserved hypothetical protein [Rhodoferax ferrireducens T118]|uniref:DUF3373 domain-containing protein n=1 Tax=Albidiferax ferrireducens (strain ATCC BAA-621 / DSM 15236 / T118) TaxID=338969 RepID=Q21SB8_ALBFT|nr:DUF3373 domain-containing protein [Rhodoferax ferrireducens]ABD71335.1 conserved hypothetical protein [Rhodoferax ferrireducens T118]